VRCLRDRARRPRDARPFGQVGGVTDDVQRRERERAVASRNAWGDLAARMRDGDIPMSTSTRSSTSSPGSRGLVHAHRVTDSRRPADPELERAQAA
jgi:hypothetical protein